MNRTSNSSLYPSWGVLPTSSGSSKDDTTGAESPTAELPYSERPSNRDGESGCGARCAEVLAVLRCEGAPPAGRNEVPFPEFFCWTDAEAREVISFGVRSLW